MSTRTTRRGNHTPGDTPTTFNNTEALILAQAVWEHGAGSWQTIAKVLAKHPLISRPKSFFTAQLCHATYSTLMEEAGLDLTEANNVIHAPMNHKLAEKYFRTRFEELRGLIIAEENQFKTIVSEIEQIRAGQWDIEIASKITGVPVTKSKPLSELQEEGSASQKALQTLRAEVFDGSDLSGTTNTPSSSKSQDETQSTDPLHDSKTKTKDQEEPRERTTEPTISSSGAILGPDPSRVVFPTKVNIEVWGPDEEDEIQVLVEERRSPTPVSTVVNPDIREQETSTAGEDESRGAQFNSQIEDAEEEEGETESKIAEEEEEEEEAEIVEESAVMQKANEPTLALTDDDRTESTQLPQVILEPESALDTVGSTPRKNLKQELEPQVKVDEDKLSQDGEVASPERAAEEDAVTSGDEPLPTIRRSTRRRSSARLTRQHKRASTEAAGSPPATPDEETEADPNADANDTDILSESHLVEGDDEGLSSIPAEISAGPRRRDTKRKASAVENIESPREKKRARDDSEPVDEDDTSTNSTSRIRRRGDRTEEQAALKRFQNVIIMLHTQISQHRNGNIFHNPIKTSEAPDYHEIVKQPTDLKKIKMKIKDSTISNSLEFKREIFHMFANAMMYNRPGSDVYVMAEDMMLESEVQIETFRQTEGLVRGVHRI